MKHFILLIGLLVFSFGVAGAQQARTQEKEASVGRSPPSCHIPEALPAPDERELMLRGA